MTPERSTACIALLIALVAGSPALRGADDCPASARNADPGEGLDEMHRLRPDQDKEIEASVDAWLPAFRCLETAGLETPGAKSEEWPHLGVHLGRLLVHLDRNDEARSVFNTVQELDPGGRWGRQAGTQIHILEHLQPGMPAPEFTARTLSGKPLSSEDLLGRVVLLDFWATWCAPCVAALPELKDLQRRFGDEGLRIVGVALDEKREPLERMIDQKGVSWPQLWDGEGTEGEIPRLFGIGGPAVFYILDRQGRIAAGPLGEDGLAEAIEEALIPG